MSKNAKPHSGAPTTNTFLINALKKQIFQEKLKQDSKLNKKHKVQKPQYEIKHKKFKESLSSTMNYQKSIKKSNSLAIIPFGGTTKDLNLDKSPENHENIVIKYENTTNEEKTREEEIVPELLPREPQRSRCIRLKHKYDTEFIHEKKDHEIKDLDIRRSKELPSSYPTECASYSTIRPTTTAEISLQEYISTPMKNSLADTLPNKSFGEDKQFKKKSKGIQHQELFLTAHKQRPDTVDSQLFNKGSRNSKLNPNYKYRINTQQQAAAVSRKNVQTEGNWQPLGKSVIKMSVAPRKDSGNLEVNTLGINNQIPYKRSLNKGNNSKSGYLGYSPKIVKGSNTFSNINGEEREMIIVNRTGEKQIKNQDNGAIYRRNKIPLKGRAGDLYTRNSKFTSRVNSTTGLEVQKEIRTGSQTQRSEFQIYPEIMNEYLVDIGEDMHNLRVKRGIRTADYNTYNGRKQGTQSSKKLGSTLFKNYRLGCVKQVFRTIRPATANASELRHQLHNIRHPKGSENWVDMVIGKTISQSVNQPDSRQKNRFKEFERYLIEVGSENMNHMNHMNHMNYTKHSSESKGRGDVNIQHNMHEYGESTSTSPLKQRSREAARRPEEDPSSAINIKALHVPRLKLSKADLGSGRNVTPEKKYQSVSHRGKICMGEYMKDYRSCSVLEGGKRDRTIRRKTHMMVSQVYGAVVSETEKGRNERKERSKKGATGSVYIQQHLADHMKKACAPIRNSAIKNIKNTHNINNIKDMKNAHTPKGNCTGSNIYNPSARPYTGINTNIFEATRGKGSKLYSNVNYRSSKQREFLEKNMFSNHRTTHIYNILNTHSGKMFNNSKINF